MHAFIGRIAEWQSQLAFYSRQIAHVFLSRDQLDALTDKRVRAMPWRVKRVSWSSET